MRVVHISSVHSWNDVRIFRKMCRSLVREGHDVHLVVPCYDGAVAKVEDGVTIHPVPAPHSRWERITQTSRRVLVKAAQLNADLHHFHDPEILPLARRFQITAGKPFIYDAHEDVRLDVYSKEYLPRQLRRWISLVSGILEDHYTKKLAGVIAATPSIEERFRHLPVHTVVQNYPLLDELWCMTNKPSIRRGFAYVGLLSLGRGIREAIEALVYAGPDTLLSLAGPWESEATRQQCMRLPGWKQVRHIGILDRPEVRILLRESLAGVLLFHPHPNHVNAQPNKLFEYMSAGLPIIASDFPLWRSLMGEAGCGIMADPLDPISIGHAMRWMENHGIEAYEMGKRGRRAVETTYNWDNEFQELLRFYDRVLAHYVNAPSGP
jgi:glycosyltransferase involved in cell wall biosynthesis